jgi:cytochrome oxidase Cu insertion factor (SCO1/SenC/PrrC family)
MFIARRIAVPFAAAAVLISAAAAQSPTDPATLGPQVGEKAIPFTLPDQNGAPRDSAALAGPNGTMLVFFRSADW